MYRQILLFSKQKTFTANPMDHLHQKILSLSNKLKLLMTWTPWLSVRCLKQFPVAKKYSMTSQDIWNNFFRNDRLTWCDSLKKAKLVRLYWCYLTDSLMYNIGDFDSLRPITEHFILHFAKTMPAETEFFNQDFIRHGFENYHTKVASGFRGWFVKKVILQKFTHCVILPIIYIPCSKTRV